MAAGHGFCALGDSRSFVDPVSTLSYVSSINVAQHLDALWSGLLPLTALPTALHEAAHHDHLCSPVGATLAAIHLRVRQVALGLLGSVRSTASGEGCGVRDLVQWRQRYEAASTVLRPVSEGLACISQFDCLPQRSDESVSFATQFGTVVAARDVPGALRPSALQAWLTPVRLSNESLNKKASIYADGFHCLDGGYLVGYLLMRSIWARCAAFDSRLDSAEAFVSVIRHVVFSDYGLVTLMLSPAIEPTALASQLVTRICWRLTKYSGVDLRATYDRMCAYRRRAAEGGRKGEGARTAIEEVTGHEVPVGVDDSALEALLFNDADDVIAGQRLLETCLAAGQTPNRSGTDLMAVDLNRAVWRRRGWFWLGSYPVTLTPVGGEVFYSNEDGIAGPLPWLSGADTTYLGSGWLTCAYSVERMAVVVAVGVDQQVLGAASHWGAHDVTFESAMRLIGEQSSLIKLDTTARGAIDEACSHFATECALNDVCAAASAAATRKIAGILLPSASESDIDEFLAVTREDGLAAIVSPDLLRACALLSTCASSGMLPESTRSRLASDGYDMDSVMRQAAEFLGRFGGECRLVGDRLRISL